MTANSSAIDTLTANLATNSTRISLIDANLAANSTRLSLLDVRQSADNSTLKNLIDTKIEIATIKAQYFNKTDGASNYVYSSNYWLGNNTFFDTNTTGINVNGSFDLQNALGQTTIILNGSSGRITASGTNILSNLSTLTSQVAGNSSRLGAVDVRQSSDNTSIRTRLDALETESGGNSTLLDALNIREAVNNATQFAQIKTKINLSDEFG